MFSVARSLFLATLACSVLVACRQSDTSAIDPQRAATAEAYIRAHISELSTEPAQLGGTFYVTDIEWVDGETARVSYEDGHVALTGVAYLAWKADGSVAVERFVVDPAENAYRNDTHGYVFAYSASMRLREHSPDAQTIGTMSSGVLNGVIELRVISGAVPGPADSRTPQTFIEQTLKNLCAADGPDASISCPDLASREEFTTASGIKAERYVLNEVEKALPSGLETKRTKGPFIVFRLPQNGFEPMTALIISGPMNVPSARWNEKLISPLVDSMRLLTGASSSLSSLHSTASSAISSQLTRPLSKEGEFCGGIAAFECEAGLRCQYDGTYPDAGGTCVSN